MVDARAVAPGFSPLDEELGLLPGGLAPGLQQGIAWLGASLPFGQVPAIVMHFAHAGVSAATVRRITEAAGAALVAVETAEVGRLERELPPAPNGPAIQLVSVDGAMVPLVGGEWREAKTVAVGAVTRTEPDASGRARELSYFSRMTEAASFARLATAELHRRGTERAGLVAGVADGAAWCQGFLEHHCPAAVRILDFPHALQHLSSAAQAVFGPGSIEAGLWLGRQAQTLRRGEPAAVLQALADLPVARAHDPVAARTARDAEAAYCTARIGQMHYRAFVAQGLPIGSGAVESANKLVVEARLKGAGMHWAPTNVDPLLALRSALCSNRWDAAWSALAPVCRRLGSHDRRLASTPSSEPPPPPAMAPPLAVTPRTRAAPTTPPAKMIVNGRPTREHPWKTGFRYRQLSDPQIPKR